MPTAGQVYRLGKVLFVAASPDTDFERALPCLFPLAEETERNIVDLSGHSDVRSLINGVLALHDSCLWLDAACVMSPEGSLAVISGGSGSGKSTIAMALTLGFGWKLLSEDITLIDKEGKQIISFASPFSLKPGTLDCLRDAAGVTPKQIFFDEWVSVAQASIAPACSPAFDLVLHFGSAKNEEPLCCESVAPADYVRLILSCSNLLHDDDAPDEMVSYVSAAGCYKVSGGTLKDRLRFVFERVEEIESTRNLKEPRNRER